MRPLLVPVRVQEVDHDVYRFDWPAGAPKPSTYGDESDLELLRARSRQLRQLPFPVHPLEDP